MKREREVSAQALVDGASRGLLTRDAAARVIREDQIRFGLRVVEWLQIEAREQGLERVAAELLAGLGLAKLADEESQPPGLDASALEGMRFRSTDGRDYEIAGIAKSGSDLVVTLHDLPSHLEQLLRKHP